MQMAGDSPRVSYHIIRVVGVRVVGHIHHVKQAGIESLDGSQSVIEINIRASDLARTTVSGIKEAHVAKQGELGWQWKQAHSLERKSKRLDPWRAPAETC